MGFKLSTRLQPAGDQPQAIGSIVSGLEDAEAKHHVLLGATGSGKTYTMANVIARTGRSALVIAPNKTLAAQLYIEFKELFPNNAVGYFISYYDYFQPEAYLPTSDTYIAKDSSINEDIDKMRHETTRSLFEEEHVVIVASVSCIYGLGSPQAYARMIVPVKVGQTLDRDAFLKQLIGIQFSRNDWALGRGSFRVRGDSVDVMPAHEKNQGVRVEFFGDEVEAISLFDPLTGQVERQVDAITIYPNSHYVASRSDISAIVREILEDLGRRLTEFKVAGKMVEYQRVEQRTMQDIEALEQLGFCPGIENYSRYLTGTPEGMPPPCLLDYFPDGFLTIIDESHITMPQIRGMFRGDRARKQTLVDFGFRLPAALDNRPLNYPEFMSKTGQILYVSATPGGEELELAAGRVSEQIIRPTGLVDPPIEIRPVADQVDDLLGELRNVVEQGGRALVTTLTKKMAEELTEYYRDLGIRIHYLHSDIDSLERTHLLRSLRQGAFDVLVGINLLREGLDLPEVMLVAVMDADKEGFLRSKTSLIQIVGRAARNHRARVIFYADRETDSIQQAIAETDRRRARQVAYNEAHGIEPTTVIKPIPDDLKVVYGLLERKVDKGDEPLEDKLKRFGVQTQAELHRLLERKKRDMKRHARDLEFEKAASLRDEIRELSSLLLVFGGD